MLPFSARAPFPTFTAHSTSPAFSKPSLTSIRVWKRLSCSQIHFQTLQGSAIHYNNSLMLCKDHENAGARGFRKTIWRLLSLSGASSVVVSDATRTQLPRTVVAQRAAPRESSWIKIIFLTRPLSRATTLPARDL